MSETRNWREAKPKWVVDAAEAEMAAMQRRLALRWPDEARPTPAEFFWGGYDKLTGKPVAGEYFVVGSLGWANKIHIRAKSTDEKDWQYWRFSTDGERWTTSPVHGPIYMTERDAKLAALWAACDSAAKELERVWKLFTDDRGFL